MTTTLTDLTPPAPDISSVTELWATNTTQNFEGQTNTLLPIGLFIYVAVTILVGCGGNILLLLTVYFRDNLHKSTYYFIVNLSVGDIIFSLTVLPPYFFNNNRWVLGAALCQAHAFMTHMCAFQTLLTLGYISIDRYLAICYPLKYPLFMTKKRCLLMIAHTWIQAGLTYSAPLLGWGKYYYAHHLGGCALLWSLEHKTYIFFLGATAFYPVLGIVIFCYAKIHRTAMKANRIPCPPTVNMEYSDKRKRIGQEVKASAVVFVIIMIFNTNWTLYVAVRLVHMYVPQLVELDVWEYVTQNLFISAAWINPVIYGIWNREFRTELKLFLKTGSG